jgi:hypothetical protein
MLAKVKTFFHPNGRWLNLPATGRLPPGRGQPPRVVAILSFWYQVLAADDRRVFSVLCSCTTVRSA